ncbi:pseudouridine synthase, partial [Neisseria sp. P0015.S010]
LTPPHRQPRPLLHNNPDGANVTRDDPQRRATTFHRPPPAPSSRWVANGRLDINNSGLFILTTSGQHVQRYAQPSFEIELEYAVRLFGEI